MHEIARTKFAGLSRAGKQVFLARVGSTLTLAGRAFASNRDAPHACVALAGLNELQHHLMAQIAALGNDADRYPDDVFWDVLHETALAHSIDDVLGTAVDFASSREN
jgi:hypothetical protein